VRLVRAVVACVLVSRAGEEKGEGVLGLTGVDTVRVGASIAAVGGGDSEVEEAFSSALRRMMLLELSVLSPIPGRSTAFPTFLTTEVKRRG
jgi:hypothetical protein